MKLRMKIQTKLRCTATRAWDEVQKPRLLSHVAAPLLKFASLDAKAFPETWEEGDFFVTMFGFGFLPLGPERIGISTRIGAEGIFYPTRRRRWNFGTELGSSYHDSSGWG